MTRRGEIVVDLERSGHAVVLREQPTGLAVFPSYQSTVIEVSLSQSISLSSLLPAGIWQYLFVSEEGQFDWVDSALSKTAQLATGTDRAYADLALRQASHVSEVEPRIYNAPEKGVVIEHRSESGILTLLVEGPTGLIVRSADDFQVTAEFNVTAQSINELLARYVYELNLLYLPAES